MRPHPLFAAGICLIFASVNPAFSDDLTPEKKADIQKLLDMTGAAAAGRQMSDVMIVQMNQAMKARRPDLPQSVFDVVRAEVDGVVRDSLPELMALFIPIYHKHFTHEEIKGLIQFYSTELGQKVIRTMPLILRDSVSAGQRWGQSIRPEIERRVRDRLKLDGVNIGKSPDKCVA